MNHVCGKQPFWEAVRIILILICIKWGGVLHLTIVIIIPADTLYLDSPQKYASGDI